MCDRAGRGLRAGSDVVTGSSFAALGEDAPIARIRRRALIRGLAVGSASLVAATLLGCGDRSNEMMLPDSAPGRTKYNELTPRERYIIEAKGTEPPFSGEYDDCYEAGTYICRRCNADLYRSEDKFDAHSGWPAFDDEILGAVKRLPDPDGERTEIACVDCGGHLGHIFFGEQLTAKNTRHCVNSLSMRFVPAR